MHLSGTHTRKVLFALLLIGLSLGIFLRHREIEEMGTLKWYDRPVVFLTAPPARLIGWFRERFRLVIGRYFYLVRIERENERLTAGIEEMRGRVMLQGELEKENQRLREALDLKKGLEGEWVATRVISFSPVGPYRMLTVDQGSEAGIARRAPVVSPGGLVGQVARVFKNESQVLLITDPTSAVDARVEASGTAEARGLVVGKVMKLEIERELFITAFEYLEKAIEVREGTKVVTSGMDGVYPPGILIGRIGGRQNEKYDIFQRAEVIPAVDFYQLRQVLILKR